MNKKLDELFIVHRLTFIVVRITLDLVSFVG